MSVRKSWFGNIACLALLVLSACAAGAGEADIKIPPLDQVEFELFGGQIAGTTLMYLGLLVCAIGAAFGVVQYNQTKALDVHASMREVSNTIWETCKTYLTQ